MIQWDEVTSQPVFELSMCGNDDLRLTLVTPAGAAAICQAASKLCAASHCCCSPCFISCLQMHHAPQILCTLSFNGSASTLLTAPGHLNAICHRGPADI